VALNKASEEAGTSLKQAEQPSEQTKRRISALISGRIGPHTRECSSMENSSSTYTTLNAD
jgi:hypothetical protein